MAAAFKFVLIKNVDPADDVLRFHGAAAENDYVGVVVFFCHFGDKIVIKESGSDTMVAVGGNGNADSRSADENPHVRFFQENRFRHFFGGVGIVAGIRIVGAEILQNGSFFGILSDKFLV